VTKGRTLLLKLRISGTTLLLHWATRSVNRLEQRATQEELRSQLHDASEALQRTDEALRLATKDQRFSFTPRIARRRLDQGPVTVSPGTTGS
jgi:hypothetical protein